MRMERLNFHNLFTDAKKFVSSEVVGLLQQWHTELTHSDCCIKHQVQPHFVEIRKSTNAKITICVAVVGKMRVCLPTIPRRRKKGENAVRSRVVLQLTTFSVNFNWGVQRAIFISVYPLRVHDSGIFETFLAQIHTKSAGPWWSYQFLKVAPVDQTTNKYSQPNTTSSLREQSGVLRGSSGWPNNRFKFSGRSGMRSWRSSIERCSTDGPPLGKFLLGGKKFGGLFLVERSWERFTRCNEHGRVLLDGTKLGGFYLMERSWEGSTKWTKLGGFH